MRRSAIKRAFIRTIRDLLRHHTLQVSAALSYYAVLSMFPALIVLSAIVGFVPLPDLFNHVLMLMNRLLPSDTMKVVYSVLRDVLSSNRGTWLSFGMLGTLWVASTGFDAMIEALDIAYDVKDDRPFWKTRLLAIALAAINGGLLVAGLAVMLVGPRFGDWLASELGVSAVFAAMWPVLRWIIAISFTVLAVELLYFLGPNVKQRFGATLPGALLAVGVWNILSFLLGIYFRHFAHFNKTYGTLGGVIAFMTWLYWTSFVLLVGAELNAEFAKESVQGRVESKSAPVAKNEALAPFEKRLDDAA